MLFQKNIQKHKKWNALFKFYISFTQILLIMLWNSPPRSLLWETKWGKVAEFFYYLQLSISRVQFCSSRGYLLKSIMQAAVVVILERRDRSQTQTQGTHHERRRDEIIWHHSPPQTKAEKERRHAVIILLCSMMDHQCVQHSLLVHFQSNFTVVVLEKWTLKLRNPWLASKYVLL